MPAQRLHRGSAVRRSYRPGIYSTSRHLALFHAPSRQPIHRAIRMAAGVPMIGLLLAGLIAVQSPQEQEEKCVAYVATLNNFILEHKNQLSRAISALGKMTNEQGSVSIAAKSIGSTPASPNSKTCCLLTRLSWDRRCRAVNRVWSGPSHLFGGLKRIELYHSVLQYCQYKWLGGWCHGRPESSC